MMLQDLQTNLIYSTVNMIQQSQTPTSPIKFK